MNKIILLGPPGAGKGTQAEKIVNTLNISQISTGQMLRDAISHKTALGLQVKEVLARGDLVSDDLIISLVESRVSEPDCANGYLFDGYPRTLVQAQALTDSSIDIDLVIVLTVDAESIVKRISGRWMHKTSGRTYHVVTNPPVVAGKDDLTGDDLIQRVDDNEQTVRARLAVYEQQTQPLINYYAELSNQNKSLKYVVINGSNAIDQVTKDILSSISEAGF